MRLGSWTNGDLRRLRKDFLAKSRDPRHTKVERARATLQATLLEQEIEARGKVIEIKYPIT